MQVGGRGLTADLPSRHDRQIGGHGREPALRGYRVSLGGTAVTSPVMVSRSSCSQSSTGEVPKSMSDRVNTARELYLAFAAGDRDAVEGILADEFTFSSPVDVGLDRAGYFERCWPGAAQAQQFQFVRLVETGDEVIVTYEMTHQDGGRGRNTEILSFDGDRITGAEVYLGWNL